MGEMENRATAKKDVGLRVVKGVKERGRGGRRELGRWMGVDFVC